MHNIKLADISEVWEVVTALQQIKNIKTYSALVK